MSHKVTTNYGPPFLFSFLPFLWLTQFILGFSPLVDWVAQCSALQFRLVDYLLPPSGGQQNILALVIQALQVLLTTCFLCVYLGN